MSKIEHFPDEPTAAEWGQLFRTLHDCMERRFNSIDRAQRVSAKAQQAMKREIARDRAASKTRDGAGGEIIEKMIAQIEAVRGNVAGVQATVSKLEAVKDSVAGIQAALGLNAEGHKIAKIAGLDSPFKAWLRTATSTGTTIFLILAVLKAVAWIWPTVWAGLVSGKL